MFERGIGLTKETDYKNIVRVIRQECNNFLNDLEFEKAYTEIIYARNKSSCPILNYNANGTEYFENNEYF